MARLTKYEKAKLAWNYYSNEEKKVIAEFERKGDALSQKDKLKVSKRKEFVQAGEDLKEYYEAEIRRLLGRVAPQATDLEEAVLGAIILESNKRTYYIKSEKTEEGEEINVRYPVEDAPHAYEKVKSFLLPGHFYLDSHAIIYEHIQRMYEEQIPIDMATVVLELRKSGKIELVGGAHYIAVLCASVASAANIEYHARCIIEFAIDRELIKYGAEVINNSYDDTTDCFNNLNKAKELLEEIVKLNVRKNTYQKPQTP